MGIWPDWTWADVSVSIAPYYVGGYWYDGTEWQTISDSHVMIAGQEYVITVSQDCFLDWLNYHFDLTTGSNTIVWEPVVIGDIIVRIPLTLTIPPSIVEDITAVIPLTLTIPPSIIDDIVVTIPLTLTIPSIEPPEPPPPPDEDWWTSISEWLTENWYMAVAAIVIFLIGIFVWARYK